MTRVRIDAPPWTKGKTYNGMGDAFATIWRKEGMGGFFKGWAANTLKVGGTVIFTTTTTTTAHLRAFTRLFYRAVHHRIKKNRTCFPRAVKALYVEVRRRVESGE